MPPRKKREYADYSRKPLRPKPNPTPNPNPKPSRIHDAITIDKTLPPPIAAEVRAALDAVGRVHHLGSAKPTSIRVTKDQSQRGPEFRAVYVYESTGRPLRIEVSTVNPSIKLSVAHEVGHYLEGSLIPGSHFGSRDWANDRVMAPFVTAVQESGAVKWLESLKNKPEIQIGGRTYQVDPVMVDYLLDPYELWARAYAQYVAARSGDAEMLAQLDTRRDAVVDPVYHVRQWSDHDFDAIAQEIDKLFRALKWSP
jgi:hypothetical protein